MNQTNKLQEKVTVPFVPMSNEHTFTTNRVIKNRNENSFESDVILCQSHINQ